MAQLVEHCFLHQESAVPIKSLANFYVENLLTVSCKEDIKIKKKRPRIAHLKHLVGWAVSLAQLIQMLLLTLEVCGSNPVIGKVYTIFQRKLKDNKIKRCLVQPI